MNKQVEIIKEQDVQVENSRKKERRDKMKEVEAMNAMMEDEAMHAIKEVEAINTINSLIKAVGGSKSDMASVTNPDIFNDDSPILKQLSYNHQQQQQQQRQSENQDYVHGNTGDGGGGGDDDDACDVFPGDSAGGVGQMLSAGVLKHMSAVNDMFVNYLQVRISFSNSTPTLNYRTLT